MTTPRKVLVRAFLTILLAMPSLLAEDQFFATLGAGRAGDLIFRTVFRISNEHTSEQTFLIEFRDSAGVAAERLLEASWTTAGRLEKEGDGWRVEVPAQASVELSVDAANDAWFGWARVVGQSEMSVATFLQLAEEDGSGSEPPLFEDLVFREAQIMGTRGSRGFAFPTAFINSTRHYNTAFALVNLSDRATEVRFTLLPDQMKTITLEPGQVLRSYFDQFWELNFPAAFPLRFDGVTRVYSDAPIAMTVFRTLEGLPLSGVEVTPLPMPEPREVMLGEEVELAPGETVRLADTDLEVTFWNVAEDSRCAIGVVCVWEGRAVVEMRARLSGEDSEFQLIHQTGQVDVASRTLGSFQLGLKSVNPIPNIAEPPIQAGDYRIRVLIKQIPD